MNTSRHDPCQYVTRCGRASTIRCGTATVCDSDLAILLPGNKPLYDNMPADKAQPRSSPAPFLFPQSRLASVTNRVATAASAAEARTVQPAVRNTVGNVVDDTRITPRPDPAASAT